MTSAESIRRPIFLGAAALVVVASAVGCYLEERGSNADGAAGNGKTRGGERTIQAAPLNLQPGPAAVAGQWEIVPMPERSKRVQAIHSVLLPSGKVLMVNGSSSRDNADPSTYAHVDNTALFDPASMTYRRIPSTPWPGEDRADIDLFCTSHVQMWNGNVLFAGGTRSYGHNFQGMKSSYEFDWQRESWSYAGQMAEGRWYATLVPRADGTILAAGGINENGDDETAHSFEIYNPSEPVPENRWKQWDARDGRGGRASPFTLDWGIDHYPRIFPQLDGSMYLTNDGTGYGNRTTRRTYFFTLPDWKVGARVAWTSGNARSDRTRTYGATIVDPTKEDGSLLALGGQQGSPDQTYGPGKPVGDADVTSSLERFDAKTKRWSGTPGFLAVDGQKGRVNHMAVILPTKQVLVVGGGAYHFYEPAFEPILMTPDAAAPGGFTRALMNPMTQPRFYHTSALLLPDGRVWVAGGNFKRAYRNNDGSVDMGAGTSPDGRTADFEDNVFPAEIWQHEVYSPPYLFLPGPRPEIVQAPDVMAFGMDFPLTVQNAGAGGSVVAIRLGASTHSIDMGQRLLTLPIVARDDTSGKLTIRMPANAGQKNIYTPGHYMLFFVNGEGKPSKAAMARIQ